MKVGASWEKYSDKMALLLVHVHAGYLATGGEKNDTTVGIPVSSGGISALCHVLCPTAFEQNV